MRPGLRIHTCLVTALLFAAAGLAFALQNNPVVVESGDAGRISIPFESMEGGISVMENVRLVVSEAPSWIVVDTATSFMGPANIYPGERLVFYADFAIAATYNPQSPAGTIVLNLLSDSTSFVPSGITWTFSTENGFKTMHGSCMANDGIPCGSYGSRDTLPPNTYLMFEGPSYGLAPGTIYLATSTLISFVGADAYESNTEISRSSITGYAIGMPPVSFEALDFSTIPIALAQGTRTLLYCLV